MKLVIVTIESCSFSISCLASLIIIFGEDNLVPNVKISLFMFSIPCTVCAVKQWWRLMDRNLLSLHVRRPAPCIRESITDYRNSMIAVHWGWVKCILVLCSVMHFTSIASIQVNIQLQDCKIELSFKNIIPYWHIKNIYQTMLIITQMQRNSLTKSIILFLLLFFNIVVFVGLSLSGG